MHLQHDARMYRQIVGIDDDEVERTMCTYNTMHACIDRQWA